MSTAGPNSPGTIVNDSSAGTIAWSNPSNAASSNNSYATSATNVAQSTQYLKATNFGFSIPGGATINGITVEVEMAVPTIGYYEDAAVRIVKGGTIGSTDKSRGTGVLWPASDAYVTFGSSSELWGETWSSSDINASNFGFAIRGINNSAKAATGQIDHVRITVTYTDSSGVGTASGDSTASGVGASVVNSVGTASGDSTASGVGRSTANSSGTPEAEAVAAGVGDSVENNSGTASGESNAYAVSLSQSVVTSGDAETGYGFNVDLDILWQTGGELTVDKSFYWNVGQQDLFWYRVQGCCKATGSGENNNPSGCDIIGVETDDPSCENGGPQQFIQNIVAAGLAELCQIIQNSKMRWQICSIQKFSRPADGRLVDPTDDCNTLTEVPFCDLPECIEFCLQADSVVKMVMSVTVQMANLYYGDGTVVTDGSAETDTDGDHGLSLFSYESDGGEVLISGSAETSNSWENDTLVECVMDISVEGEEAIFSTDPNANTLSELTFTVSTDCGSCDAMPLTLNVGHNLSATSVLSQFLKRNGLTIPESIPMHYSKRLQSWLGNYHLVGIGNDNANTQELWRFTFEWSCVSQINGINTDLNYWKFSILAVRNNGVTDIETRIILIFPPDEICDEDQNFAFDFSFNLNTTTHFVNTDIDLTLSDVLVTDNIGLFKSQTWTKNPYLRIKLSRDAVIPSSQYQDIYPIFPQVVFGPSR